MRDGREVGSLIKSMIFGNEDLKARLKGGVLPYPAIESTEYPFVVYIVRKIEPYYTKDKVDFQDTITVEVFVWANTYEEKIKITTDVYACLQNKSGIIDGFDVSVIQRIGEAEIISENGFGQSMVFRIDINKI